MTRLAAILTCLALAGCAAARSEETRAVEPGTEVTLAPAGRVSLRNTDVKIRFVAVTEDSRCPRDVTCVWAGEVKVLLEIGAAQAASQVEIPAGGSQVVGAHRVTVVRVEPQRISAAKIAPQDYRVTLKLDDAG